MVEQCGRFSHVAYPGCNTVWCCIGQTVRGSLTLRVQQLDVTGEPGGLARMPRLGPPTVHPARMQCRAVATGPPVHSSRTTGDPVAAGAAQLSRGASADAWPALTHDRPYGPYIPCIARRSRGLAAPAPVRAVETKTKDNVFVTLVISVQWVTVAAAG